MRLFYSLFITAFSSAGLMAAAVYDVGPNTSFASFSAAFAQIAADAPGIPATTTISVEVRSGTYLESVVPPPVAQPLVIMGLYGEDPLIVPGSSYGVHANGISHLTLQRLHVRNSGSVGIFLENCPGASLSWNHVQNNGGMEIQLLFSPYSQASDNDIKPSTGSGLVLQFSPNSTATANTVTRHGAGAYSTGLAFSDSPGSLLARNRVYDALTGFGVYNSQGTTLSAGLALSRNGVAGSQGAYLSNSDGCVIRNNLLVGQPRGLEIQSSGSCAVQNNTFWEHGTVGLLATLSSPLQLRNNLIQGYNALDFDIPSQSGLNSNYNLLKGESRVALGGSSNYPLLSNWQSTGNDLASVSSDPLFINASGGSPEDFRISGGSPAREGGSDLSADFTLDFFDNQQDAPWDMGFHASSGVQATPTPSLTPSPIVPSKTVTKTPSPTISPTFTPTAPNSPTPSSTISPTMTISPTFSATPYPLRKDKLTSYPNPYEPSKGPLNLTFDGTEEASVKIFDIAGTLVAEIAPQSVRPAEGYASWDGKTTGGQFAPSGLYFAVLRSAKGNRFTRFTVLHR